MTNREIDALIAEKAYGWAWWVDDECVFRFLGPAENKPAWWSPAKGNERIGECYSTPPIPRFSTDPAASKQLRDKMRELGWVPSMQDCQLFKSDPAKTEAMFRKFGTSEFHTAREAEEEMAWSLAALRAVGVDVNVPTGPRA